MAIKPAAPWLAVIHRGTGKSQQRCNVTLSDKKPHENQVMQIWDRGSVLLFTKQYYYYSVGMTREPNTSCLHYKRHSGYQQLWPCSACADFQIYTHTAVLFKTQYYALFTNPPPSFTRLCFFLQHYCVFLTTTNHCTVIKDHCNCHVAWFMVACCNLWGLLCMSNNLFYWHAWFEKKGLIPICSNYSPDTS